MLAGLAPTVISSPVARVAAFAWLLGRLYPDRQLLSPADPHLLSVPELFEHDFIERRESPLGVALARLRALGDGGHELRLC